MGKTIIFNPITRGCVIKRTAALLSRFGFGHILEYTPITLTLSALHFTLSNTPPETASRFSY